MRFDRQIHVLVGSKLGTEEEEYKILNDMNAILTVPRNLMKNVISGVFNKTNTSMPRQSFHHSPRQRNRLTKLNVLSILISSNILHTTTCLVVTIMLSC